MKEITIVWINRKKAKIITTTPAEIVEEFSIDSEEPDIPPMGITPEFRKKKSQTRRAFFESITEKIAHAREIVLFGSDNTKEDFLDYLNEHENHVFSKVIGVEASIDIPEEKIIARGRKYL